MTVHDVASHIGPGLVERLPRCNLCGTRAVIVVDDPAGHRRSYCSHDLLLLGPLSPGAVCRWAYDVVAGEQSSVSVC